MGAHWERETEWCHHEGIESALGPLQTLDRGSSVRTDGLRLQGAALDLSMEGSDASEQGFLALTVRMS